MFRAFLTDVNLPKLTLKLLVTEVAPLPKLPQLSYYMWNKIFTKSINRLSTKVPGAEQCHNYEDYLKLDNVSSKQCDRDKSCWQMTFFGNAQYLHYEDNNHCLFLVNSIMLFYHNLNFVALLEAKSKFLSLCFEYSGFCRPLEILFILSLLIFTFD